MLYLELDHQLRKNRKHKDYSNSWVVDGFSILGKDGKIRYIYTYIYIEKDIFDTAAVRKVRPNISKKRKRSIKRN